jgi:type II secretion system protein G
VRRAFTLIELLIVVAIIAILAAIAVPNFLEAQTRAKVSRAKSDLRTSAIALEAYYVDNNAYPLAERAISVLTTPISYLTNAAGRDPFGVGRALPPFPPDVYVYTNFTESRWLTTLPALGVAPADQQRILELRWFNASRGPDTIAGVEDRNAGFAITPVSLATFFNGLLTGNALYDPTNGTISPGDIILTQRGWIEGALRR